MPIGIRIAGLFDLAEVAMIQRAAIDSIDNGVYGPRERAVWRAKPIDDLAGLIRAGRYRVAESGGVMVGGAGWEEAGDGTSATVRCVFVHPAAHGQGVGAALLAAIEAEIAARGFPRLLVPAALNAVGFYERLGYRVAELREAEIGGVKLRYRQMFKDAA